MNEQLRKDLVGRPVEHSIICEDPCRGLTPRERLLLNSKVDGACWIWQLRTTEDGYGKVQVNGRTWLAHRASYTMFKGPIPEGLTIDHLCKNTLCVNPAHLESVTDIENKRRALALRKALKTHCKRGHERTPENTYVNSRGNKQCLICVRLSNKRYDAKRYSTQEGTN